MKLLKEGEYKDLFGEIKVVGDKPNLDGKTKKPKGEAAELQKKYDEALKAGDNKTMVRLKREIFEFEKKE